MKHANYKNAIWGFMLVAFTTFSHGKTIRSTSYCPQEPGGFYSCTGKRLQRGDCAADLNYYPLGTRIKLGTQTYTVADCGSAVRGPNHIDIYCPSLNEMRRRGTVMADVDIDRSNSIQHRYSYVATYDRIHLQNKTALRSCVYNSKRRPEKSHSNNDDLLASL